MSETTLVYIKSRKSKEAIEIEARLLLENKIQDKGDDDVLDMAISIAHKENKNVKFVFGEKEIEPEMAYRLRYDRGLDIRR